MCGPQVRFCERRGAARFRAYSTSASAALITAAMSEATCGGPERAIAPESGEPSAAPKLPRACSTPNTPQRASKPRQLWHQRVTRRHGQRCASSPAADVVPLMAHSVSHASCPESPVNPLDLVLDHPKRHVHLEVATDEPDRIRPCQHRLSRIHRNCGCGDPEVAEPKGAGLRSPADAMPTEQGLAHGRACGCTGSDTAEFRLALSPRRNIICLRW